MKIKLLLAAITVVGICSRSATAVCIVSNVGGTADLPPVGCDYVPPSGDMMQILPPSVPVGDTIDIDPVLKDYSSTNEVVGGSLGGNVQTFNAILELTMSGTGTLAGFHRNISVPVSVETHSASRTPGDAVQSFDHDLIDIQGTIFGDPDFDTLSIVGGVNHGLPSPGHTTLTRLGGIGSDFQVDSFFDVAYEIDFQGSPGSLLEGMGGRTDGTVRLQIGNPIPEPSSALLLLAAIAAGSLTARRKTLTN